LRALTLTWLQEIGDLQRAQATFEALEEIQPDPELKTEIAARVALAKGDMAGLRAAMGQGPDAAADFVSRLEKIAEHEAGLGGVAALMAAAKVSDTELGDVNRAVEFAGLALAYAQEGEDSLVQEAATVLLELARRAELSDWQEQALQVMAERGSGSTQLDALRNIAQQCERRDAWQEAVLAWMRLVAASVDDGALPTAAERLCMAAEQVDPSDEVVSAIADSVEQCSDAAVAEPTLIAASLWAADQGVGLDRAADALTRWHEHHEQSLQSLQAAERVAVERGDWSTVVNSLEQQALVSGDDSNASESLRRAASLADSALEAPGRAAQLLGQVLQRNPNDGSAWLTRLDCLDRAGDEAALDQALSTLWETKTADRQLVLQAGLSRIERQSEDASALVAQVASRLLAPEHDSANDERLYTLTVAHLHHETHGYDLAKLALPIARIKQLWADVLACREILDRQIAQDSSDFVQALLDQAEIAHNLQGGSEQACQLLSDVIKHPQASIEQLKTVAQLAGLWELAPVEEALTLCLLERDLQQSPEEIALRTEMADRCVALERPGLSIALWQGLTVAEPQRAAEALEGLMRLTQDVEGLLELLENLAHNAQDDEAQESAWLRLASVHLDDRAQPQAAIEALRTACENLSQSVVLATAHLELLREYGQPLVLLEALESSFAAASDQQEQDILHREIAQLASEHAPDRALAHWLPLLAEHPDELEIVLATAAAILADADPKLPTEHEGALRQTIEALEPFAEHDLIDSLLATLGASVDEEQAVSVWIERTQRSKQVGGIAAQLDILSLALSTNPMSQALIEIADEALKTADPTDAHHFWAQCAAQANAPLMTKLRAVRAALSLPNLAAAGFDQLEGLWRSHPDQIDAQSVIAAARQAGLAHIARALVLEHLEETESSESTRSARAALAAEFVMAGDIHGAIAQWQRLVIDDPSDETAIAELRRLCSEVGEQREAQALILASTAEIEDPDQRLSRLLHFAAQAMEEDEASLAVQALDTALAQRADSIEAWEMRGVALAIVEDDEAIIAHLRHGASHLTGEDKNDAQLGLIAHLSETNPLEAFEQARDVLQSHQAGLNRQDLLSLAVDLAKDEETAQALLESLVQSDLRPTAGRMLVLRQPEANEGAALMLSLIEQSQHSDDAQLMLELWRRGASTPDFIDAMLPMLSEATEQARVLSSAVNDLGIDAPQRWLEQWSALEPDNHLPLRWLFAQAPTEDERWLRLCETLQLIELDGPLEVLLSLVDVCEAGANRAAVFTRAATLAEQDLNDPETAAAYLQMAFEQSPDETLSKRRLELLRRTGDEGALADSLMAEAQRAKSDAQAVELLDQACELWLNKLNKPSEAIAALELLVKLEPDQSSRMTALALAMRAGNVDGWEQVASQIEANDAQSVALIFAARIAASDAKGAFEGLKHSPNPQQL
ncbi:MAG TPA: hypothetical protein DCQ06_02455, partial [Myxococcales bacterium]|nr:hypothetical protein [Myxococcales bacterium]